MVISLISITKPEEQQIKHNEPNTSAFIKTQFLGKGDLFISFNRLSWIADNGQGFQFEYPNISLHAISRDLNNFHSECLYVVIDEALNEIDTESGLESDENDSLNEIRFVPEDKNHLETMFKAMSECQLLHPDPNDSVSDEGIDEEEEEGEEVEGGGDIYEDAEENGSTNNESRNVDHTYSHVLESSNQIENRNTNGDNDEAMEIAGQFEDADP